MTNIWRNVKVAYVTVGEIAGKREEEEEAIKSQRESDNHSIFCDYFRDVAYHAKITSGDESKVGRNGKLLQQSAKSAQFSLSSVLLMEATTRELLRSTCQPNRHER